MSNDFVVYDLKKLSRVSFNSLDKANSLYVGLDADSVLKLAYSSKDGGSPFIDDRRPLSIEVEHLDFDEIQELAKLELEKLK